LGAIVVAGCSRSAPERSTARTIDPRTGTSPSPRVVDGDRTVTRGGGAYKVGRPYQVAGRWYFPAEDSRYDRTGLASWYGADFGGRRTANGEIFDKSGLTAAHPTLPLPSLVYVTNLANGRTILVRVNDRGPYVPGRIIDLSQASARALDLERGGVGQVRVTWASRAPLDGDDTAERRHLAAQPWYREASGRPRWALGGSPSSWR
jgi:rare lipoprotein A